MYHQTDTHRQARTALMAQKPSPTIDGLAPAFPLSLGKGQGKGGICASFLRKLGDEPVFNLLAGPRSFAQERETGLHRRIELETPDRDAPPHLAPTMPLDELIDDALQRNAMQRITWMR